MAKNRICSIPDCGKTAKSKQMCESHYRRLLRHGDPLAGPVARGVPGAFFMEAMKYAGDDCIKWPFAQRGLGRGAIHWNGKTQKVHRVMCEQVNGPPPTPRHHAAHSCGNGHEGCITPAHLSWKTPKENEADKILHGTRRYGEKLHNAKLSDMDVADIRAIGDSMTRTDIAKMYGVSVASISSIILGKTRVMPKGG